MISQMRRLWARVRCLVQRGQADREMTREVEAHLTLIEDDLRRRGLSAEEARLGSATLRFAYLPDEGGHWLLTQTIGVPATIDFLLRQRIVDGREAYEMGLVHAVCPLADLPERTATLAREMAEGPQGAMRFLKKAVYRAADQTHGEALDDIGVRTAITDHLADAQEGGRAFVEKRKANFGQD